jgi:hypothetical protein
MLSRSYLAPGFAYEVISEIPDPTPEQLRSTPAVDPGSFYNLAYLEVPNNLDRVRALAQRITEGVPTPYEKAIAIQTWLERNCPYTLLEEAAPPGQDAVEYYLFTTKEGACDLVGSAMALMCRAVGIPARVAVGYSHDQPDAVTGAYPVSQADAHLWVELYFPSYGWVTFNPAPTPRQTPNTVAASLMNRFRRLWRGLVRGGLATGLSLLLIGALMGVGVHSLNEAVRGRVRRRRARQQMLRSDDATVVMPMLYGRMCELLARQGWPRSPSATPNEYLAGLRSGAAAPPSAALDAAERLTERFTATLYSAEPVAPADVEDARRQLLELTAALRSDGRKQ